MKRDLLNNVTSGAELGAVSADELSHVEGGSLKVFAGIISQDVLTGKSTTLLKDQRSYEEI